MTDANSIPRYAPPTPAELAAMFGEGAPAERPCGQCGHACYVGALLVCCFERDKLGVMGEVYEVQPEQEGCRDWESV